MSRYITVGRTKIERELIFRWPLVQRIIRDGRVVGYRLYYKGCFNLPCFDQYWWLDSEW